MTYFYFASSVNETGSTDAIINLLKTLVGVQEEILHLRNNYAAWNCEDILWEPEDPDRDAQKKNLHAVLHDFDSQHMLLSGWKRADFESFVLLHAHFPNADLKRAEITFDHDRIIRKVIC